MEEKGLDVLSEEEIKELASKHLYELRLSYDDLKKLKNTINEMEKEFTGIRGLKRFISPGILVSNRLILGAEPNEHSCGIFLRAFGYREGQIMVPLTVEEAERLSSLLKKTIEVARKMKTLKRLKSLYKESQRRRY